MIDLKMKVSFESFNLDGTVNIKMNDKLCIIDLHKIYDDIDEKIENEIKILLDDCIVSNEHVSRLGIAENFGYNKDKFINDFIKAMKEDKTLVCSYRGIGKSFFIEKLARKFDLPIISKGRTDLLYCGYEKVYRNGSDLKGILTEYNTVLVDDVSIEYINELRKIGLKVVGFARVPYFY